MAAFDCAAKPCTTRGEAAELPCWISSPGLGSPSAAHFLRHGPGVVEGRETSATGPQLPKGPRASCSQANVGTERSFLVGDTGAGAQPQLLHHESLFHIGPGRFQLTTAPSNSLQLHSGEKQILRKRKYNKTSGLCPSAAPKHAPWGSKISPQASESACFQRNRRCT